VLRSLPMVLLLVPAVTFATPRALPFSYPYATLGKGGLELEQFVDLTPVRGLDTTGALTFAPRGILTTELEYGLTDRLELALYVQMSEDPASGTGDSALHFDGIKQRLRLRLAEAGEWPVDVALYGEIAELRNEFEVEAKVIIEKRVGRLQVITNLWAEHEFYYDGRREWVVHPTAGASFDITPAVHLGAEYWMHAEFGGGAPAGAFNPALHHYVGPALLLLFNRFWWVVAPYVRVDAPDRPTQLGDQFGRLWVRTIVGIDL
jgi:hypothetical protein